MSKKISANVQVCRYFLSGYFNMKSYMLAFSLLQSNKLMDGYCLPAPSGASTTKASTTEATKSATTK